MESWQRVQAETRRDDEEVKSPLFIPYVLTTALAASFLLLTATGQTAGTPFIINTAKDLHRYALYSAKPEYPSNLRYRHIQGSGVFLIHIRPDGTVQSVDTVSSTGNAELDDVAKSAFIKWRFRPGPTAAKVPITFTMHGGGWPFPPR